MRRSDYAVHGLGFPYHYSIGTMIAESGCRATIVSFDGGIGCFQFTPSTGIIKEVEKGLGIPFDPRNTSHSIRAYSYYIHKIMTKDLENNKVYFSKVKKNIYPKSFKKKCGLKLSYVYQMYNGGYWLIYEFEKGNSKYCDKDYIKQFCGRTGTYTPQGQWLDFCQINYSYSDKIKKYSKPYNIYGDGKWKF